MNPFAQPEQTMEIILAELRTVDAALAAATREENEFLSSHRHLRTEVVDGQLITLLNAHLQHHEIAESRKEFAALEAERNALVRKRNDVLHRYAKLKTAVSA